MRKGRKKRKPGDSHGSGPPPVVPSESGPGPPFYQNPAFGLTVFLVGLGCYLVLFFTSEFAGLGTNASGQPFLRYEVAWLLLVNPFDQFDIWIGGDASRVAIFDRVPVLLGATVILGIAYITGRLLLELARADVGLTRLETFLFSTAVGLNVLSLYTLAVGLAGGLRQPTLFAVPAAMVFVVFAWRAWRHRQSHQTSAVVLAEHDARTNSIDRELSPYWLLIGIPFVIAILLGGMLPPWEFDVCEYHLQVPKEWYRQGSVGFLPHNVYGNMPLGAEMHAVLGMVMLPGEHGWWWGALVGKTVIAALAPLTALGLYAAGRRFFGSTVEGGTASAAEAVAHRRFCGSTVGVVAALIYISTPWIAQSSMIGWNEGASAFYLLMTVYAVMLWWTRAGLLNSTTVTNKADEPNANGEQAERQQRAAIRGRLLLAGFLAGAAVACKYPSLLFVAAPLTAAVLLLPTLPNSDRSGRARWIPAFRWREMVVFFLAVVCGCGLWFGKNWVLTGNPTYPLIADLFDGKTRTPEKNKQWQKAHQVPRDKLGRRYSIAQLRDSVHLAMLGNDWLNPFLVPLAAMAILVSRRRALVIACFRLVVYIFAAWWLATHRIDRFLLPALPLAALLAGIGASWFKAPGWQVVIGGILLAIVPCNLPLVTSRAMGDARFLVALDDLFAGEPHPGDPYAGQVHPAHRYLNQHVPDGYQALFVGEAQVFDIEVPILYNTCFDDCVFEQLMKGRSRDERLAVLRERRISHVFVHWGEIDRYRATYGFTDYVTKPLVHDELVQQQGILRQVELPVNPESLGELFEVVDVTARRSDVQNSKLPRSSRN